MPTIQGIDTFAHGDFTVPGGGNYSAVTGSPAKDTTVLQGSDPASLLLSASAAAENVQNNITGSPTLPWHAYWFRMASADEPGSDLLVAQMGAADGNGGRLIFQPSSDKFYHHIIGGSEFPLSGVYTFGSWVWIEHILDTSSGTRTMHTRIAGVNMTPTNRVVAASTGSDCLLGWIAASTGTVRYSNHHWGVALSTSDWMGEPGVAPALRVVRSPLRW